MKMLGGNYLTEHDLRNSGFRSLGRQVKVHERASLYGLENISLGDHVRIDDFSIIIATGLVTIGCHVSIPNFCFIGGKYGVTLEDFVTLAPGVKIFSSSDDYLGTKLTGPTLPLQFTGGRSGPVTLRRHAILGAGSVVLPACTLGEGAAVGALSLVTEDLPPWNVYAGIPVRQLKGRRNDLLQLERQLHRLEEHER